MTNIITLQEARTLSRPIGKVADDKLKAMITEVEYTIIRPAIGEEMFLYLTNQLPTAEFDTTFGYTFPSDWDYTINLLKNGGTYNDNGYVRMFVGLKTTESYFVYAQNVMSGEFESTRYGMVVKSGEYSDRISSRERSDIYNSVTAIAKAYLADVLHYMDSQKLKRGNMSKGVSTTGCIIHKIG